MFLFKKILAPFFFPVPVSLVILFAGIFLLWFTKRQRAGRILVSLGAAIVAFCSFKLTSDLLIRPLEERYPPYGREVSVSELDRPKFVVVLSGGFISNPKLPLTSQVNALTLTRLIEGIIIYRETPGSKLVLLGGSPFDPVPNAKAMARIARSLGVDEGDIIIETESRDTDDQARILNSLIGDEHFILVTSASHMPRSMALFRKCGMNPIPAPTEHLSKSEEYRSPGRFFPSAENMSKSERAVYEYVGLLWSKLWGYI